MLKTLARALACSAIAGSAAAAPIYSQDFEGAVGAEWSGAGTLQSSQGLAAFGFGATHLKNDGAGASVLTLTGLAPHSVLTLQFDLAMWDSLDYGADFLVVQLDGVTVMNETFGNYFPPSGSEGPGIALTPPTNGAFDDPQYGYNVAYRDSARRVTLTLAHSGGDAQLSFQFPASQGAPDEAFGIDNLHLWSDAAPVPEPETLLLMAAGLGMLGAQRRRARS